MGQRERKELRVSANPSAQAKAKAKAKAGLGLCNSCLVRSKSLEPFSSSYTTGTKKWELWKIYLLDPPRGRFIKYLIVGEGLDTVKKGQLFKNLICSWYFVLKGSLVKQGSELQVWTIHHSSVLENIWNIYFLKSMSDLFYF